MRDGIRTTHHELVLIGLAGSGLMLSAGLLLGPAWAWSAAGQWLVQAGALWCLVYAETSRRLPRNRSEVTRESYHDLGWANRLTLLRGGLIAAVGGFLFQPWPAGLLGWLPGVLYTLAAVLDRLDGYVARKSGRRSELGGDLDNVFDALGLAVAPLLAVWYGQLHWSYLAVSCAYYLFHLGLLRRRYLQLPVRPLTAKPSRRALAGFQMGLVAAALLPLFDGSVTRAVGVAFMLPILAGFLLDWLGVSGRLRETEPRAAVIAAWLLPALRAVVLVAVLYVLMHGPGLPWAQSAGSSAAPAWFGYLLLPAAAGMLIGLAGRLSALVALGVMGWYYSGRILLLEDCILLTGVSWVLLFGTGRLSLWQLEDAWLYRYAGE